jgi:uncharacterized membrane protein YphA (DoxX/SURF4 family)
MRAWSIRIVRWLVAAVFALAGVLKLFDQRAFAQTIGDFGIVPDAIVPVAALVIPIAELVVAALLFARRHSGLAAVTAMLVVYIAVVGYGLWIGLDIDCGCLGSVDELWGGGNLRTTLVQDLVLLGGCAFLWIGEVRKDRFRRHNPHA